MKKIYIIYNEAIILPNGGYTIDGGAAGIDCEWDTSNADGSTQLERIPKILAKNSNRRIIYLPHQDIPDGEKHKIKNGKIVELTEEDKEAIEAAKPKSEIESLKEKVTILEDRVTILENN